MKVLAFLGSPRKGGNSETALKAFLRGVGSITDQIEIIRLCDLKINPCIGCGGCEKEGKCVVDDDMTPLYEKILTAKRIVLASPIYFYGITAQAKAFVDRCQALWSRKYILKKAEQWVNDPLRKGFFISVAATRGERVFEGALLTMKYAFDAMDVEYSGDLLLRGIDRRGEVKKHEKELAAAERAGREFASKE